MVSEPVAWLGDTAIGEAELLDRLEPGLSRARGDAPVKSAAWNAFAFALGYRLLAAYAKHGNAQQHVIDFCARALLTVAHVEDVLARGEEGRLSAAMIEATLRPMTMMSRSPAAALENRIFLWGMRRVRRDRTLVDSLASLVAAARDAHAELAELTGGDPNAARDAEAAAQRADALRVLAGEHAQLVPQ